MNHQTPLKSPPRADGQSDSRVPQPVAEEIAYRDPLDLYAPFSGDPHAALLESAVTDGVRGRYSYIAAEP
ncbi:MAG TPA: hypothetical protein VH835_03580, partial [Dongiaceae bacterium]